MAWSAGDSEAFEALVRHHEAPILRHARALLGAWRGGEDVVQEVFLRLAQKPPTLPADVAGDAEAERSCLSGWLHRVTRNLAMDVMRSETRRRRREEDAAVVEASSGGLDKVDANDTRAAVERGLSKLSADQREVLVLRIFDDKSYREIAEITGRKVGTVGWMISVGLKALAGDLGALVGSGARGESPSTGVRSLPGGMS